MNKKGFTFATSLVIVCIISCSLKTTKLPDGRTKVPVKSQFIGNREMLSSLIFSQIDTNSIYWRHNGREDAVNYVYRFYGNGLVNLFVFRIDETDLERRLDPNFSGYRGAYFFKNDKIQAELYAPKNGIGEIGKLKKTFTIAGDTLYEFNKLSQFANAYVKKRMPKMVSGYRALW